MIKVLSFVFLLSIIFGQVVEISDLKYSATIERDEWGVPHIYGNRDSDVSFGLAYAHSQDDFKAIRDIILASRAKLPTAVFNPPVVLETKASLPTATLLDPVVF